MVKRGITLVRNLASHEVGWTLFAEPRALAVQYEHTVVTTKRGALVVTLPS